MSKNKDILDEKKDIFDETASITILPCHLIW